MTLRPTIFGVAGAILISALTTAWATESSSPADQNGYDDRISSAMGAMMSDPATALNEARSAEDIARSSTVSPERSADIAKAFWLQAEALSRLNRPDEAMPLIDRGLTLLGHDAEGSKIGADLILARARAARAIGDDRLALSSYHDAHDLYAALGVTRNQAMALQGLGSIYNAAGDYERVLEFYGQAATIHPGDRSLDLSSFNNKANALRELGRYAESIELFRQALDIAEDFGSPLLIARVKANIATTQITAGDVESALPLISEAISAVNEADEDDWAPIIFGVEAQAYAELGETARAAALFDNVFQGQDLTATPSAFSVLHQSAYTVYRDNDQPSQALAHLEAFKRLDDSARDIAADTNNVLITAEFDFANQELEIANLTSAQLRNQIALRASEQRTRNTLIISGAGIFFFLAIGLIWGLLNMRASRARIAQANKDLADSNAALDKANKAKTQFLAATSHEIRTPLNGILGLTQVMLTDDRLEDDTLGFIDQIRGAGNTLLAVVNDVLDMATIESGSFDIQEGVTNAPGIVRDVVSTFEHEAQRKGLNLTFDTADFPEAILTDSIRLRQILFNLVSNALKFTSAGSVSIQLKSLKTQKGEYLGLRVRDTGIGIPNDQLSSIFETFHQLDNGRTRQYSGTGLGLAIVHQIVQAMKGEIKVVSTPDQGSTFSVVIPLNRVHTNSTTDIERNTNTSISDLDILVVEDNVLNRTVITALLKNHVKSITATDDGIQGVAAVNANAFDVILMDKQMPNMDGISATRTIRAMENGRQNTYIIAVTADAYDGAREELLAEGMDDYLSKPISVDKLLEALQTALNRGLTHSPEAAPQAQRQH